MVVCDGNSEVGNPMKKVACSIQRVNDPKMFCLRYDGLLRLFGHHVVCGIVLSNSLNDCFFGSEIGFRDKVCQPF